MAPVPARRSTAGTVVLLLGLLSSVALVGLLARQVAREREKSERAQSDQRGIQTQLSTIRAQLKDAREELRRLEEDRARRASIVEGETGSLRHALVEATRERDALDPKYRAAVSERDRALENLLAARRELEALRTDLARAVQRAAAAEGSSRDAARESEESRKRLAEGTARVVALLRPLLQDLRSNDGSLRVRAHEALCAYAGRDLPFRPNAKPEEREEDARAIEAALSVR